MKKILIVLITSIFLLVAFVFLLPEWYLWTENNNFKKLRIKSALNCETMPLHCAIRDKNLIQLNSLLANKKYIDSRDLWKRTALIYAVMNSLQGAQELITYGANVNLFDENGESALSYALQRNDFATADLLIDNGSDLNFKIQSGNKNMTLLTNAISNRNVTVAKYLIKKGASLYLQDDYGYNPCGRIKMYHLELMFPFISCTTAIKKG